VLRKAPGRSSPVRDDMGHGPSVKSRLGLETVGSMQAINAGIQGRLLGALLQRSLEV
jgi:hypothetical protein